MSTALFNRVNLALNNIRPYLNADEGDVELLSIEPGNVALIELKGACSNCHMSAMTVKSGIEETIKKSVPEITAVKTIN